MKTSTKKALWWVGGTLALVLVIVMGVVVLRLGQAKDVLDNLTQPTTPQREMGVYVLESDPAQTLEDTVGYSFGGLAGGEEAFALLSQSLGKEPPWQDYPTAFALADALGKGERQAVLLEEAYQQSLADAQGYEWTAEGMRKVGSLQLAEENIAATPPRRRAPPPAFCCI